ncbi:2490_t:CDS:2, partial [Gigaspora rosea]
DGIVKGKKIPNLSNCSECEKEIISHPLKAFTTLFCGHTFHRLCIEKKLLLTIPNICPFSGCSEEVKIIETEGRRGSESSTSSVVRRMEKHSIQDMPEIQEEDMPDVDDARDKNNHPTDKSTTPSGEESRKRPTKKEVKREDSPLLKKSIQELTLPTHQQVEGLITLQSSISEMDVASLDFLDLYNKIDTAEDNLQRTTHDLI